MHEQIMNPQTGTVSQARPMDRNVTPDRTHPAQIIQRAVLDFSSLSSQDILQLQSSIGNKMTIRFMNNMLQSPTGSEADKSKLSIQQHGTQGVQTPATSLPYADRIKQSFGHHGLNSVKAHLGAEAGSHARAMGAAAYTRANDIVFARQPDLATSAHEAAHVIQQRNGLIPAGGLGEAGDPYERQADAIAQRVAAGQSAEDLLDEINLNQQTKLSDSKQVAGTVISSSEYTGNNWPTAQGMAAIQMIKVGEEDYGKTFKVPRKGITVTATLVEIKGGGWYTFQTEKGETFNIHGQDKIEPVDDEPSEDQPSGDEAEFEFPPMSEEFDFTTLSEGFDFPSLDFKIELPPVDDKPMDAKSRLTRAQKRAKRRFTPYPLRTRVDNPTPYGMTGLSRQRFSEWDPRISSRKDDFPECENVGETYSGFLPKVGNWDAMVDVMDKKTDKPPKSLTSTQQRSGAMFYGVTQDAEKFRFEPAPKIARSATRKMAKQKYKWDKFPELFPMAKPGGGPFYKNYLKGDIDLDEEQKKVVEDMSESSGEEEEEEE